MGANQVVLISADCWFDLHRTEPLRIRGITLKGHPTATIIQAVIQEAPFNAWVNNNTGWCCFQLLVSFSICITDTVLLRFSSVLQWGKLVLLFHNDFYEKDTLSFKAFWFWTEPLNLKFLLFNFNQFKSSSHGFISTIIQLIIDR